MVRDVPAPARRPTGTQAPTSVLLAWLTSTGKVMSKRHAPGYRALRLASADLEKCSSIEEDGNSLEYLIKQYPLERGALEIQYIEEFFGEFPRKKTADEIAKRLREREFL